MPNNPKAGGVSRRIEGSDRKQVKENLDNLKKALNSWVSVCFDTLKESNKSCSNFEARVSKLAKTESDNELKQ